MNRNVTDHSALGGNEANARRPPRETGHPPLAAQTITTDLERVLLGNIHVFVNLSQTQTPVKSRIRSWREGQYLFLDGPQPEDQAVRHTVGAVWMLQYKLHGLMCEAKTEYVEQAPDDPTGVHVTYPRAIRLHPLREHYRAQVDAAAQYGIIPGDGELPKTMHETTLCDLSMGGCAFRAERELPRGSRVCLAIVPSPGDTPVRFTGIVRRTTAGESGLLIGLQFDVLTWEQRPVLVRMLGTNAVRPDPLTDGAP